ncbi:MAG: hypothetical protein N2645_13535 [Clostridia bacterium]|nr:hypothetical protein [Clostridia bacterium]
MSDKLIEKLLNSYAQQISEGKALDEAEKYISSYFSRLRESLKDAIKYSEGEIKIEIQQGENIAVMYLKEDYILFKKGLHCIRVCMSKPQNLNTAAHEEEYEVDRLVPSDYTCKSVKENFILDYYLLDKYIDQAFKL